MNELLEIYEKSKKNLIVKKRSFETVDALFFENISNNAIGKILSILLDYSDLDKILTHDQIKKLIFLGTIEMLEADYRPLPYDDLMYDSRYYLLDNINILKIIAVIGFEEADKVLKARVNKTLNEIIKDQNKTLEEFIKEEYTKLEAA